MFMHIINYAIRGLIILIGIFLLSGAYNNDRMDASLLRVMGAIFILFGVYRIVLYRTQMKKYNFSDRKENEDFENDNEDDNKE